MHGLSYFARDSVLKSMHYSRSLFFTRKTDKQRTLFTIVSLHLWFLEDSCATFDYTLQPTNSEKPRNKQRTILCNKAIFLWHITYYRSILCSRTPIVSAVWYVRSRIIFYCNRVKSHGNDLHTWGILLFNPQSRISEIDIV